MIDIKLTKEQEIKFAEINILRNSADSTLDYALKFHSDKMNEVKAKERDAWKELIQIHNLDIKNDKYRVEELAGELVLIKIDNDD